MARLPRLALAGFPHHVVLRGVNGTAVFHDALDYQAFLDLLAAQLKAQPIGLHAYALVPGRIHLLLTPEDGPQLSAMMQGIGRRYVRYFNQRHKRFGTLWEGRFRAGPMQPAPYVLAVMTYFDWLPVLLEQVNTPADYRWTSHRHFAGQSADRLILPHELYWQLADTPFGRQAAYQTLVGAGLGNALREQIERSAMGGWLLGSASFVQDLALATDRRLGPGKPGRPRKKPPTTSRD